MLVRDRTLTSVLVTRRCGVSNTKLPLPLGPGHKKDSTGDRGGGQKERVLVIGMQGRRATTAAGLS